jgi:hypothetical protein
VAYTGPFTLSHSALVKAKAFRNDMSESPTASASFTVAPGTISLSPESGVLTDSFRFRIHGQTGQSFVIEASSNLATWRQIATVTLTSSTLDFNDFEVGESGRRFYRAVPGASR